MNIQDNGLSKKLLFAIIINSIFTVIEFIAGYISSSLSLISDASENLTDVLSLIISYFGYRFSLRKPNNRKTFGYARIGVLSAFANIVILFFLIIYMITQLYYRFYNPDPVSGNIVVCMSLCGIFINGSMVVLFSKYKTDLNIQSAIVNMLFDTLVSLGAFISGLLIIITHNNYIDTIVTLFIIVLLCFKIYNIIYSIINILLESVPNHIDLEKVEMEIETIDFVERIEHLHIWQISNNDILLSCNIVIDFEKIENFGQLIKIIKQVKILLSNKFNINHSTIEIKELNNNIFNYENIKLNLHKFVECELFVNQDN